LEITLQKLAQRLGGELHGDGDCVVSSVATLQNATPGSLTFLANRSYRKFLPATRASVVLLSSSDLEICPVSSIVLDNPYLGYAQAATLLYPAASVSPGVHATATIGDGCSIATSVYIAAHAVIEDGVVIGEGAYIGPGCVVGRDTIIGEASRLSANVSICHGVMIGKRVLVHPGAVIGSDGFGIANDEGEWFKVPQIGTVRIGDDVEIGANTTIDRGALEDTVLEEGVQLDNQIQVAHNVSIGAHTAIAGCVGIAGSARIGKHCAIGGGTVVLGHLEIADHVHVTAMSLVTSSVRQSGVYSSGTPLEPNTQWHKNFARFRRLDEMYRRLSALEKKFDADNN
jgi:UDP-3-O-[3-hydroxymyristoyl] glucosamine N-acyltransferase